MILNAQGRNDVHARLSGIHTATKALADGRRAIYAYAFKGGPLLARGDGLDPPAARRDLEARLGRAEILKKLDEARRPVPTIQSRRFIGGLVTAWLASEHFAGLSATTRRDYRRVVLAFATEFGAYPVAAFDAAADGRAIDDLVDWRNEKRATPRAADYRLAVVGALFRWARGERLTRANPITDIAPLHRSDRSARIWTAAELQRLYAVAPPQIRQAVELASLTGLRTADLLILTWPQVSDHALMLQTSKSRRRRTALIPLFPATRALLDEIGRRDLGPVLLNSRGQPWTQDGFKTSFRKAKADAGIQDLHFHDLRGTAVTRLKLMGVEDDDIALIVGWSKEAVRALLMLYVSADTVALDMLRRITERTGRHKPPTNRAEANSVSHGKDWKSP